MASRRGRKRNDNLPPNRARDVQRAFRARRAAHLQDLEARVVELEDENEQLRVALNMPPSNRPKLGSQGTRSHRSGDEELESDTKPDIESSRHSSGSISPAVRSVPTMQQPGPSGRPPYMTSPYNLTPTSYTTQPPSTSSEGGWADQSGLLMPNGPPHNAPYFQPGKPPHQPHLPPSHSPPGSRNPHNLYLPTYPMTDPNQKQAYHDDHFPPHHNAYSYQQPPDPSPHPPHPPHSPNSYAHSQQSHRENPPSSSGQYGTRRTQTDPQRIINHYPQLPPMQLTHQPPAGRHSVRSAPAHLLREEPESTERLHDTMI